MQEYNAATIHHGGRPLHRLGATAEGPAGPRGDGSFHAGYFRDPDGNKLNAFCMG